MDGRRAYVKALKNAIYRTNCMQFIPIISAALCSTNTVVRKSVFLFFADLPLAARAFLHTSKGIESTMKYHEQGSVSEQAFSLPH